MTGWWEARTPRERLILGVAAALLIVTVYWLGLLRPLQAAARAAELRSVAAIREAQALEAAAGRLAAPTAQPNSQGIRAPVLELAAAAGLTLSRLSPEGDGGLTVSVEPAPSGAVFGWIARLAQERGIDVSRLTVEQTADKRVIAQATFVERGR